MTESENYIGFWEYNYEMYRAHFRNTDTLEYENKNYFVKDYISKDKRSDGTCHFVLQLSKDEHILEYIGTNE